MDQGVDENEAPADGAAVPDAWPGRPETAELRRAIERLIHLVVAGEVSGGTVARKIASRVAEAHELEETLKVAEAPKSLPSAFPKDWLTGTSRKR